MQTNQRVLFGGQVVTIRGSQTHITTGRRLYLIEHEDGSFSRVGSESLVPIEVLTEKADKLPSVINTVGKFLRQPSKKKVVLR